MHFKILKSVADSAAWYIYNVCADTLNVHSIFYLQENIDLPVRLAPRKYRLTCRISAIDM